MGYKKHIFCQLLYIITFINLFSQTNVKLYPTIIRDIGGYTEVQEIFGIMTGNIDNRSKPFLKEAKITGIRNIINWLPTPTNPPGIGFLYPVWSQKEPMFATVEESYTWYDGFLAMDPFPMYQDMLKSMSMFFDDQYGVVNVTLAGSPFLFDGRLERNLDAAKIHMDAYIQGLKNSIPAGALSRLRYFQIANEPHSFKGWCGQFNGDRQLTIESYTRVYNAIYDYLKLKHPDVTVIGNCIGHDGAYLLTDRSTQPGVNWNVWVKYFIDSVDNPQAIRFFNPHCYSIPSVRNLAYASMTQNYGEISRGVRPRYIITETSAALSNEGAENNYRNQMLHIAHDIFMMLDNPDKYAARYAFVAMGGMEDSYSIFHSRPEEVIPQSPYWVLSSLRNLRGTNISLETDNNDVFVHASAPADNMVVAGLLNPSGQSKTVILDIGLSENHVKGIIQRKAVWNATSANADYSESNLSEGSNLEIIMEPLSVYAIEIELNNSLSRTGTARTREFYGTKVKTDMSTPVNLSISVPELPDTCEDVFLQIAFDKRVSSGILPVTLNGFSYNYDLSKLPVSIIQTWHDMVGFVEIQVNKDHVILNNTVTIGALTGRTLLFASLKFREKSTLNTSVNDIKESVISIYPNPVKDILRIDGDLYFSENPWITIYDLQGKIILSQQIDGYQTSKRLAEIYVGNLSCGLYYCMVSTSERKEYFKFIKM